MGYIREGRTIIGIDEVGRGAWAGPVVAAAVILPDRLQIPGLNDSKKLTPRSRLTLDRLIRQCAKGIGIGWVSPALLDEHGLTWAVRQSGLLALSDLLPGTRHYQVILDGSHNYLKKDHPSVAIVEADCLVTSVAAASVVAKVARDRYMTALSRRWVGYRLEKHKGYGTADHRAALARLGPSPCHRLSYTPVARLRDI